MHFGITVGSVNHLSTLFVIKDKLLPNRLKNRADVVYRGSRLFPNKTRYTLLF